MINLEEVINQFRAGLAKQDVTFLLVYSYKNLIADTYDTKIASNSSQQGVRAILSAILRPTAKATAMIAQALEDCARASVGILPEAIDRAQSAGTFVGAATALFEQLRPYFTIAGWEREMPQ